jgi:hypothetical protein
MSPFNLLTQAFKNSNDRDEGMAQVRKCLPNKYEALS